MRPGFTSWCDLLTRRAQAAAGFPGRWRDAERRDLIALTTQDLEAEAEEDKNLPRLRNHLCLVQD